MIIYIIHETKIFVSTKMKGNKNMEKFFSYYEFKTKS